MMQSSPAKSSIATYPFACEKCSSTFRARNGFTQVTDVVRGIGKCPECRMIVTSKPVKAATFLAGEAQ